LKPTIYIGNQYWREEELLFLKLNEFALQLKDYNWKIIIVENDKTFTGKNKEYNFDKIKDTNKFSKFKDNIIHIKMNGFGAEELQNSPMQNDFIQKRAMIEGFKNAKDNDILVICDLDEIPDFRTILTYFNNDLNNIDKIYSLQIRLYYYYYNCKALFEDDRVTICKKKDFKGVDEHRAGPSMGVPRIWIPNAGWHFSYLGGTEAVKTKVQNFGHSELNTPEVISGIEENIKNLKDIYGRGCSYRIVPINNTFPQFMLDNINLFKHNFYNDLRG
jgi:beta-1,4-mannosyl-glycoprotein beta-1,4-N-acetylglucosaminyltransferase